MSPNEDDKIQAKVIEQELDRARISRNDGNEGRARVCARRAAGWAIESICDPEQVQNMPEANAYRFLLWFGQQDRFPRNLRDAAVRLTTKVDQDFELPFEEDPIEDAEMIINWAMGQDV